MIDFLSHWRRRIEITGVRIVMNSREFVVDGKVCDRAMADEAIRRLTLARDATFPIGSDDQSQG